MAQALTEKLKSIIVKLQPLNVLRITSVGACVRQCKREIMSKEEMSKSAIEKWMERAEDQH